MTRSNPVAAAASVEAESRNTPPLKLSREERKGEAGAITLTRIDPQTGEVRGEPERVSGDHFAAKTPVKPRADRKRRESPHRRLDVLHAYDYLEPEAEYWLAHADRLTRQEAADISAGRTGSILRPVVPDWPQGHRIQVARNVWANVHEIKWTHKGYRIVFHVADHRAMLMKRGAGYTHSAALAVPESEDVMDDKLLKRLHAEASMSNAFRQSHRRVKLTQLRLEERLNDARKKNRRSTVRYLERQLSSLSRKATQNPS